VVSSTLDLRAACTRSSSSQRARKDVNGHLPIKEGCPESDGHDTPHITELSEYPSHVKLHREYDATHMFVKFQFDAPMFLQRVLHT
jgi:hypothetical protein